MSLRGVFVSSMLALMLLPTCGGGPVGPVVSADVLTVADVAGLRQAAQSAQPGAVIAIAPGEYQGPVWLENVQGAEGKPIVIRAADPNNPPVFRGGSECLHFVDAAWLELRDLVLTGATGNGLNMDDGGSYDTPSHHIVLANLRVSDIGPEGNHDGIKLSGVDDFRIEACVVERWGAGGSAIDMVGCHRGVIEGCTFRHAGGQGSSAIQNKGGSSEIVIRRNRFEHPGQRAVNIGGSTGLQFFRPQPPPGYEAKDITVEGNIFVGAMAPVAFVGVDGAVVRFNTIYLPGKWALRILQETREPGFVPCRNGVFTDNIVVFHSRQWNEGGVNIGPGTAPESFVFARNLWYCVDRPDRSQPNLPTAESEGLVGLAPQFVDPDRGDFSLAPDSPARGKGHTALPQVQDHRQ